MAHALDDIEARFLPEGPQSQELRRLFGEVAAEQGWRAGGELDASPWTEYIAAYAGGKIAGGVVLMHPDENGCLPLFATWPELSGLGFETPIELTLLALAPEFRGDAELLWTLCAEAWRHCRRNGFTDQLAAVPPRNLRIYRRLGWCPEPVGPERAHWGEPCLPCRIGIVEVADEFARRAARSPGHALAVRVARRD